jgi:hypothetical protein
MYTAESKSPLMTTPGSQGSSVYLAPAIFFSKNFGRLPGADYIRESKKNRNYE